MSDRKIVIPLILSSILVLLVLAVMTTPAVAAPNDNASDEGKENAKFIPDHAVKISQGVYSLGKTKDVTGKEVEGFMFIDYKKGFGKPEGTPGGGPKEKTSGGEKNTCFSLYAKGAKWKTTEPYKIDSGISPSITAQSLNQWDNEVSFDIFGSKISVTKEFSTIFCVDVFTTKLFSKRFSWLVNDVFVSNNSKPI